MENIDMLFAEIGGGSLAINSLMGRFMNLYFKDRAKEIKPSVIEVKKNKDGVLVDGESGLLIRYAGCCTPVMGDDIIGYISRGRGVTIHRKECPNLKYLEKERLIGAKWEDNINSKFVATIKIIAENEPKVVDYVNNVLRNLKITLKAFNYKKVKEEIQFNVILEVNGKEEIDNAINIFEGVKGVKKVYRSE